MKYNIHNIWKGNAPPKEEGNPFSTVISKEGRLRDLQQQSSTVTDSSPDESGFGMTRMIGGGLLNMRDGPRGRAPAIRFVRVNGLVTLNKPSVPLCGFSVDSVVKQKINHKERGEDTENTENYTLNPTKAFRQYCTGNVRLQEEKPMRNIGMVEYWSIRMLDCHPELFGRLEL
ncbi:hypothetical protein [uncultured Draconibacterium sp.]|uniref:hypothetical protein n=1 Tax=uncultured Draconibacterium sp. TaxID=1573823 RepID=UPI0029C76AA0|nr:hypothetical protein [uncultured Draconibacterium sp.]